MTTDTVLRLVHSARQEKDKEHAKKEAYKKRAQSKSDFYSRARINAKLVDKLKEALLISAIIDENDGILMKWSDELIQEIEDSIIDDGPINGKR